MTQICWLQKPFAIKTGAPKQCLLSNVLLVGLSSCDSSDWILPSKIHFTYFEDHWLEKKTVLNLRLMQTLFYVYMYMGTFLPSLTVLYFNTNICRSLTTFLKTIFKFHYCFAFSSLTFFRYYYYFRSSLFFYDIVYSVSCKYIVSLCTVHCYMYEIHILFW